MIGGFFLSALLPPRDDSEPSFYEVLGLDDASRTIDDEQLRKAYRKLSLKFHPDKIAQRGGVDKEAAAAEYERIQEAYHVLIVEKKRLKYDALGTPTRYRFVERGGFADPQSLYENLTASSVHDKSRLVVLFGVAILLVLMQPILIAAKVNQSLQAGGGPLETSSWFAILIPYWVFAGLFIVLTFVVAAFFVASTRDRIPICLTGLEQFFWYLGIIFLWYVNFARVLIVLIDPLLMQSTHFLFANKYTFCFFQVSNGTKHGTIRFSIDRRLPRYTSQ